MLYYMLEKLIESERDPVFEQGIEKLTLSLFDYLLHDQVLLAAPAFTFNEQHRIRLRIWQFLCSLNKFEGQIKNLAPRLNAVLA